MQAVGRIGSYISKSVVTVSGPFHPFGGAVDIIVVEQPDGSYKSSPWYVRFGKFQGVLKTKEKVVSISVNGVEVDFHMYLDHKGEAFFLKEVDGDEGDSACSPPSSSSEDTDRQPKNGLPLKSKSYNYDSNWSDSVGNEQKAVTRVNSRRSQILGLVFGRRSTKEGGIQGNENAPDVVRTDSLERAEIAADLLDLRWSTNLASPRHKKDTDSRLSAVQIPKDEVNKTLPVDDCGHDETGRISHTSYQEMDSTVQENGVEMKCLTSKYVVETASSVESVKENAILSNSEVIIVSEAAESDLQIQYSVEKLDGLLDTSSSREESASDNIQCVNYSEASESSEEVCVHAGTVQNMTQPISVVKSESERDATHGQEPLNIEECLRKADQFRIIHEEKMSVSEAAMYGTSESFLTESYSQLVSLHRSNGSLKDFDSQSVANASTSSYSTCARADERTILADDEINKHGSSAVPLCDPVPPCIQASRISEEEQLVFGNLDEFVSADAKHMEFSHSDPAGKEAESLFSSRVGDKINESSDANCCSVYSLDQSVINDYINDNLQNRRLRTISSEVCFNKTSHIQPKELTRMARSLPSLGPLSDNLEASDLGHFASSSSGAQTMAEDDKILKESREGRHSASIGNPLRSVNSLRGSRRSWSFFKRSRSMKVSHVDTNGSENPNAIDIPCNCSNLEDQNEVAKVKVNKKKVRTFTPTSEQLASLNLKEGKNSVVFTFSTAMLGKQQVDARIFLWRWDTLIVISDVDGTITRSDLLGQFMPLVGMDWSQTGVANLFSAIKDNGYQLLFLSARSISQSFHTRQFLFNIKQDGKALPEGPVVISPDGLFPSLFREVVRRAPHEFKIACLEAIKALFPLDINPFYAGFGNRDTDEFSYLKVGIPRGKIFIINPKGEIVVNRRVDTKSYLSLHALVHGMFPSMSSSEQEDFNSWNYWKLPPPSIDV
ncbi:Protein involved in plasmid maintenance/nuclear protein involved in lipid metabolism [Handroanthus impetiginosus]|uniref:Protein involved in plasmid maintenance/nuclear protein involved in lipid metabolism n=1 Tax=Handroanthus impetiginosus TaxID=429701 RepID=A0A2G9GXQ1_9LAMI|nr:Protein involved in plasmid maintenance/nuclear protein involved in lipid metabolism [Handroanthus impetiginosus]